MGWLRSVGSIKLQVSFAEYSLFYRALARETYNFIDPTSQSHPICMYTSAALAAVLEQQHLLLSRATSCACVCEGGGRGLGLGMDVYIIIRMYVYTHTHMNKL